jgi:hypothetical protein
MIYWLLFIILEIRRHYVIVEIDKERPNYLASFGMRAFFGFVGVCIMYPYVDPVMEIYKAWVYVLFQLTSFWILFDLGLNLYRQKPWYHKGKNSGWLDKLPVPIYWSCKAIALGLGIWTMTKLL